MQKDMQIYYKKYFDITSRHKKRQKNDMQPQFSYVHWLRWFIDIMLLDRKFQWLFLLREAPKSTHVDIKSEAYKYEFGSQAEHPISYIPYYNDMKRNKPLLEEQLQSHHTKVCLG